MQSDSILIRIQVSKGHNISVEELLSKSVGKEKCCGQKS